MTKFTFSCQTLSFLEIIKLLGLTGDREMEQKSSNDEPKVRKKRGLFYCFKKENYQQL